MGRVVETNRVNTFVSNFLSLALISSLQCWLFQIACSFSYVFLLIYVLSIYWLLCVMNNYIFKFKASYCREIWENPALSKHFFINCLGHCARRCSPPGHLCQEGYSSWDRTPLWLWREVSTYSIHLWLCENFKLSHR